MKKVLLLFALSVFVTLFATGCVDGNFKIKVNQNGSADLDYNPPFAKYKFKLSDNGA